MSTSVRNAARRLRTGRNPDMGWKPNTIDRLNDEFAEVGLTLHPTKGFRRISVKRTLAQMLVDEVGWIGPHNLAHAKKFLAGHWL